MSELFGDQVNGVTTVILPDHSAKLARARRELRLLEESLRLWSLARSTSTASSPRSMSSSAETSRRPSRRRLRRRKISRPMRVKELSFSPPRH